MKYLLNYANLKYLESQKHSTKSAYYNGFDHVFEANINDLSYEFIKENANILSYSKGAGYWLWKPYLILEALKKIEDGDYLFYLDSGACFIDNVNKIIDVFKYVKQDIMPFGVGHQEIKYTKKEVLSALKMDESKYLYTEQMNAGIQLIRKSKFSIEFYREYLEYCKIEELLTDVKDNTIQYKEFIDHRHDQSIYSLLCKKYDLEVFRDPSQWGNISKDIYQNSKYDQLILHHRNPN